MIPVVGMKPVVLAQWSADLPFPLQVSGSTPHEIARCTRKPDVLAKALLLYTSSHLGLIATCARNVSTGAFSPGIHHIWHVEARCAELLLIETLCKKQ
jgi:hypothetical protein